MITFNQFGSAKSLRYRAIIISMIILLGNLAMTLFVRDERLRIVLIDLTMPLWNLLATIALFYAAKRSAMISHRLFLAWGILALAQLSYACGDLIWAVLEVGLSEQPFPSLADPFYLLYIPLFFIGILLLTFRRLEGLDRLKTFLDMSIVMLAALLGFWNFLLGPLVMSGAEETLLTQVLSLAYPAGDLVLLSAVLLLLYHQTEGENQTPLFLLAAGAAIAIITDSIYGYQSLLGIYLSGDLLDLGWVAAYVLFGLAGIWQATSVQSLSTSRSQPVSDPSNKRILNSWITYLPYAWLAAAFLLLVRSHSYQMPMSFSLIAWGVGSIISIVLIRQIVTLKENTRLFGQLQGALDRVQRQTTELSKANQDLQIEIDERRHAEQQLAYDALHDALTGLPNRVLFIDRLRHAVEFINRRENYDCCVLFLDLDQFKVVNDSLGHTLGDQLLIALAQRLRMCLRTSDTVARLGGDEFVILLEDVKDAGDFFCFADRIQEHIKSPFNLEGHQVFVSASIGIVPSVIGYDRAEDILRDADIAMYHAKAQGKARYEVFNTILRDQAITRLEMENDLRDALEQGEFALNYQPIISLKSNQILGFEALLRWHHPKRGLIKPLDFIPMAEETGIINQIGYWVLHEACSQMRDWQIRFPKKPPLTISVNISGSQLNQPDFVEQIRNVLQETGLDGNSLRLEITEGVCLNNSESMLAVFNELKNLGVQFQIDDFGTGYSSLSYLQYFPIQTLKIDRAFIVKMHANSNSEIVRAIIALARDLGIEAIAEGIETEEQLNDLKEFGCNSGQGYLISHPVDSINVEKILNDFDAYPVSQAVLLQTFHPRFVV